MAILGVDVGGTFTDAVLLADGALHTAKVSTRSAQEESVVEAARLGITRVTLSTWCSAHHRDRFYSHRASGGRDGRMVAFLGMLPER